MTQQRLNNLMILHVHKEQTDGLILKDVANEFVGNSQHRKNIFGKFDWQLFFLLVDHLFHFISNTFVHF